MCDSCYAELSITFTEGDDEGDAALAHAQKEHENNDDSNRMTATAAAKQLPNDVNTLRRQEQQLPVKNGEVATKKTTAVAATAVAATAVAVAAATGVEEEDEEEEEEEDDDVVTEICDNHREVVEKSAE